MTEEIDNEVRINILVDRERNNILNHKLPWGAKSKIIRSIVEFLIDDLNEDDDGTFYAALLKGNVKLISIKE